MRDLSVPTRAPGSHALTVAHLDALLARAPEGYGVVVSGTEPGGKWRRLVPYLVTLDRVPEAAAAVADMGKANVYTSVATMTPEAYAGVARRGPNARGGREEWGALTCLWADLDVETEGHHSAQGLPHPPTLDAALGILDGLPVPTFTTSTGGGLHAYWLLTAPLLRDTAEARTVGEELAAGWVAMISRIAATRHRWHVDAGVGDLPRVLRLVGTNNNKTDTPERVRFYTVPDTEAGGTGGGLAGGRPWTPGPTYEWRELANIVTANTPPPVEAPPAPAVTSAPGEARPARRRNSDDDDGPRVLDAVKVLPWSEVWPEDWTFTGHETVKGGHVVEVWKRPGKDASLTSAKCWPDGGCHVWSDNVPGLPAGKYGKAHIYAWRLGYGHDARGLAELSRAIIAAARGRK
jgi:hypothetical protein